MAHLTFQGPFLSLETGQTMTWFSAYPPGVDPGIVIQDPNIVDDPFLTPRLDVLSRSIQKTEGGVVAYVVVHNPGPIAVTHDLNIEDWQ